jgi:sulfhydrogenase subunit beta (sulfur reductase)
VIAVNCSHPAATCFCSSTGDGPRATDGFHLALDERDDGFLVQCGSDRGQAILANLALAAATADQIDGAQRQTEQAEKQMTRRLPGRNLRGVCQSGPPTLG